MRIFNVGNSSINLYLVVSQTHRLLFDAGFPGSTRQLGREMRKTGYKLSEIDYLMVSHFHIDHAGAVQEIKAQGARFILFPTQLEFILPMEKMIKGKWNYTPLVLHDNLCVETKDSEKLLESIGIHGRVLPTPGHTDDSISLILNSGETFTGDLPAEPLLPEDANDKKRVWSVLRESGASIVYPAHGKPYHLKDA